MQVYIDRNNSGNEFRRLFLENKIERVMLVCGASFLRQNTFETLKETMAALSITIEIFSEFSVNPQEEEAEKAVNVFENTKSDMVIGAGGGSALDIAKYVAINREALFFAIPTTAGTGSEATPFAVLYKDGEKKSVEDIKGIPRYVLLDGNNLISLPKRQKIATMCDALSHAIESVWSVNATKESIDYSKKAIRMIMENREGYLNNQLECLQGMLEAANFAGKAIAISKTTASHAMAYKLTSLFGFAHGEAVMLSLPELCTYMIKNSEQPIKRKMTELKEAFGVDDCEYIVDILNEFRSSLLIEIPTNVSEEEIDTLCRSVNADRLHNFPISFNTNDIKTVYKKILMVVNC